MARKRERGRPSEPWWRADRGAWYVWHGGRQVRLAAERRAAMIAWAALLADVDDAADVASPPVADSVADYLAQGGAWKPKTVETKRLHLDPFAAAFGARRVATLGVGEVRGWIDAQGGRSTRWLAALTLRAWLRWAGHALRLSYPAPLPRRATCMPTLAQHEALVAGATAAIADALALLHCTGMRPGEACRVEARHVDLGAGVVVLDDHKTDRRGRRRVVPLGDTALALVRRLCRERPAGPLCPTTPRELSQHVRNRRRRDKSLAGVVPYGYRHAFITDALARGVSEIVVAEIVGHRSTRIIAEHYAHLDARLASLRAAASVVR